ncbi:hypothetical protein SAMN04489733_5610 [Amycolatopsis keratiniphila]|nr:hypothetical protein SAMN04489733_5610 [Amycolatopsis keratiniphila]
MIKNVRTANITHDPHMNTQTGHAKATLSRYPSITRWRPIAAAATLPEAVRANEEVVPVNIETWVLPSGVTVGR